MERRVTDRGAEARMESYAGGGLMGLRGYAGGFAGVNVYNANPEDVRFVGFKIRGDKILVKVLPGGAIEEIPISEFTYRERVALISGKIRGSVSDPPYTFYVVHHRQKGDVFFTGSVGVLSNKVPIEDVRSRAGENWNPDPAAKGGSGKKPKGPGSGADPFFPESAGVSIEIPWQAYAGAGVLLVAAVLWWTGRQRA